MENKLSLLAGNVPFGVTPIEKDRSDTEDKNVQELLFSIDVPDQKPERKLAYTRYGTWEQRGGDKMLDFHIEQLGKAIQKNFRELFDGRDI